MIRLKPDSVRVVDGKVYKPSKGVLECPSMLLDMYNLVDFGSYSDISRMHRVILDVLYRREGVGANKPFVYNLSNIENISNEAICYILRRCFECFDSAFIEKFVRYYREPNFNTWIDAEMRMYVIQVSE